MLGFSIISPCFHTYRIVYVNYMILVDVVVSDHERGIKDNTALEETIIDIIFAIYSIYILFLLDV